MLKIISLLCYYLIWTLSIVLITRHAYWYVGLLMLLFVQVICFYKIEHSIKKLSLLIMLSLTGWLFDSLASYLNWIHFYAASNAYLAPVWLLTVWISFIFVFYQFFNQKIHKTYLWSSLGFVFFPLSYFLGCYLGAGVWVFPTSLIIYALWGAFYFVYMRFLFYLYRIWIK